MKVLFYVFVLCASSVRQAFSLELPKYDVLRQSEEFEERAYDETMWISTCDEDPSNVKGMYLRLFYYMQGANSAGKTIETTAPMLRHIHNDGNVTMLLYLPSSIWSDPPLPTDNAVNITTMPANTYLVRQFGGFANDEIWLEELEKLREATKEYTNVTTDEHYEASYSGFHDVVGRRNEIWLIEQKQTEE